MKITENFLMVSNYNADISWILDYTDNYVIYDRSESDEWTKIFPKEKVIRVANIGWDIYDKFTYIIDNYEKLPQSMILTKGNIFKYISKSEFDKICNKTSFTPLSSGYHRPQMPVAFYDENETYHEKNTNWYLGVFPARYIHSFSQFAKRFGYEAPEYIPFSPGSNYIVTREEIQKYPKEAYVRLRSYIDYTACPGEAQVIERFLYTFWKEKLNIPQETINTHPKNTIENLPLKIKDRLKNTSLGKIFLGILKKIISHTPKHKKIDTRNLTPQNGLSPEEIQQYRKKIHIYDIFTFFNEYDLLEIRLEILDPYVDYFVIIEATETFSGKPKPLYYEENKNRFKKWEHKIIHYVTRDTPQSEDDLRSRLSPVTDILDTQIITDALTSDNVPKGQLHWLKEFYQKESIKKALTHLQNDDICFIGDVDEIWNPEAIIDFSQNDIFKMKQEARPYYLNNRSSEAWAGTLVTKYINIKRNCLNHLRTVSKTYYTYVDNGGWHFTNQGGAENIKTKLESYGHQEFNTSEVKSQIEKRIRENKDFIGRPFTFWIDESTLPEYIQNNKETYKHLFKHDTTT